MTAKNDWRSICQRVIIVLVSSSIALAVAFHVMSIMLLLLGLAIEVAFPNRYRLYLGLYCICFLSLTLPFDIDPVGVHSRLLGQHFGVRGHGVRFVQHYRYPPSDRATLQRRMAEDGEFIAGALPTQMCFDPGWILVFNWSTPDPSTGDQNKERSPKRAPRLFGMPHVIAAVALLLFYSYECRTPPPN